MDPTIFLTQILMPALWQGLIITLALVLLTAPFGLLLGIGIALGRQYGGRALSSACPGYIIFFKGCPLLLLLFMIYFGLPTIGITLPAFTASVLGFILCNAAYNSEYIRGAIRSIKDGPDDRCTGTWHDKSPGNRNGHPPAGTAAGHPGPLQ